MPKKEQKKQKVKNSLVFISSIIVSILVLGLSAFNLSRYFTNLKVLGAKTEDTQNMASETYWKEFLSQNPTYFDGWIELAKLEEKLQNKEGAQKAIGEAIRINPNSEKLNEFSSIIQETNSR